MTEVSTINVSSAPITTIAIGHECISVSARNGKNEDGSKRVVSAENRYRGILIPELSLNEAGIPQKFQAMLLSALRATACDQLRAYWDDATDGLRTVPASVWNADSLVMFAARTNEAQRITSERCEEWFRASSIGQYLVKDEKKLAQILALYQRFVPSVCTASDKHCSDLLALLGKFADEESPIWRQLLNKATKRRETLLREADEIAGIDDLVNAAI